MTSPDDITVLLGRMRAGESGAGDRLFPLVYDELRRMARGRMRRERPDHTLAGTELVHEAYLRLVRQESVEWRDRAHFYAVAATAMRRILVDHARRRAAARRGGAPRVVPLDEAVVLSEERGEDLVALDDALDRLGALEPRLARVVECRFFAGMTETETAAALDLTERTVRRDWVKAKGWLYQELKGDIPTEP